VTRAPDGPGAEKAGHSNAPPQSGCRQRVATSAAHGAAAYLPAAESQRHGVALCLSGGGFRAALFHLGAARRLNEYGFLSQVDTISSVSGGSIFSAHLAQRISPWPVRGVPVSDWEDRVAAPFREFTGKNLRTWLPLLGLLEQLLPIGPIRGAAVKLLAKRYVRRLTPLRLPELPDNPRFVFCATDMVFGVNWVFDSRTDALGKGCVGDYQAGYAHPAPPWFVGRAVAASSCFPPVFNPVPAALSPKRLTGGRYRGRDRENLVGKIGLSDGGVYDNLGLEPVWKDHLTVLVSDGGGTFKGARDRGVLWRLQRYFAIASNQGHALRKRWLISNFLTNQMQGAYWGIGSTSGHYGTETPSYSESLAQDVIAEIRTDLDAFSPAESAVLENHGYLLAEAAIQAHLGTAFPAPGPPPALVIPHPEWMDEDEVRRALATSGRSRCLGRR
jgi:NTE family protein